MHITRRSQIFAGLGAPSTSGAATAAVRAVRSLASGAGDIAMDQINGVTFRSQIAPDVDLTASQAVGHEPPRGGLSDIFMRVTKPAVYVDTSLGTIRLAPWGEPTLNLYPLLLIGTIVGIGAFAGILWRGLQK